MCITSLNVLLVPSEFPQVVLSVEKTELGISAGLQDRVIQTYGGLVHMDFTGSVAESDSPYTKLSPALLPSMYLAYNTSTGGESGAVHNTVRSRWEQRDPELVDGMRVLGNIAAALWMLTFSTTCFSLLFITRHIGRSSRGMSQDTGHHRSRGIGRTELRDA